MSRRESVGRLRAASQPSTAQPTVRMVSCAVLPPRLPVGMAPATGVEASGAINFDEALNWENNRPQNPEEPSRRKSLFRKVGLTTQRQRAAADDDLPPFVMRQIPYDTWRKHYAKDKDGNYHGTHAPAEDCLLKPEDVQKWRLGEAVSRGDRWTRGSVALPVYSEVQEDGALPEYRIDDEQGNGAIRQDPNVEPTMTPEDDRPAESLDASNTQEATQQRSLPIASSHQASSTPMPAVEPTPLPRRSTIADGKTADEIIAEYEARRKPKLTWKQKISKAAQSSMMNVGEN